MRPSNKMQKVIERIANLNGVDLASAQVGSVYLKIENGAYMDLIIEKPYPNTISIAHYYSQNGDLIQDPEITFLIERRTGKWFASTITQPPIHILGMGSMGGYQELIAFEGDELQNGTFSRYKPKAQRDAAIFGNKWADNIRRQGFIKKQESPVEQVQTGQVTFW